MKIGVVISSRYNLNSIFFLDYHRILEDIHRYCDISLAANMTLKSRYSSEFLYLKRPRSTFIHNRYMVSLSNRFRFFNFIRFGLEAAFDKRMSDKLISFFTTCNPDILYLFPRYPDLSVFKLSDKLSLKIVVEFWEDQIVHLSQGLKSSRISRKYSTLEEVNGYNWVKQIVQISDRIIVPTEVLKERLVNLIGLEKKIFVVPVCQDPFIPQDPSYVRLKYGLKNEKILFYLGSLTSYHDLRTLFKSLKKINSSEVVLLIAGGTNAAIEKHKDLIKELKIQVIYAGRLTPSKLAYYISAADICLSIYKFHEPSGFFPASLIKFMLAGKPIIATDLPEIREMFKGLGAGLLVQQNDVDELALAIDFLLDNFEEGIKMGTIAQKIAENNYLWKHHTKTLVKIFDSLK